MGLGGSCLCNDTEAQLGMQDCFGLQLVCPKAGALTLTGRRASTHNQPNMLEALQARLKAYAPLQVAAA